MRAMPPPDAQVLPEADEATPGESRPEPEPIAAGSAAAVGPSAAPEPAPFRPAAEPEHAPLRPAADPEPAPLRPAADEAAPSEFPPEPEPIVAGPAAAVRPSAAPESTPLRPAADPEPTPLRPAAEKAAPGGPRPAPEPIQVGARPAAFAAASVEAADPPWPPTPDGDAAATVIPRRPVIEDAGRSRTDIPWLGIASWLLLCGALFASLVGWPDQATLNRLTSIWDEVTSAAVGRAPAQQEPTSGEGGPASEQDVPGSMPARADEQQALPPIELAPPIRSQAPGETGEPADGGPPLPRFKPSVDRVAAKFSHAFFEFGDRLQQQGDFAAAVHMRRQGTNLDPWGPRASNL